MQSEEFDQLDYNVKADIPYLGIVIKYGGIGVLILIALSMIQFRLMPPDMDSSKALNSIMLSYLMTFIQMIVYFTILPLAVREYKRKNEGFISFMKGFIISYLTGLLMVVITTGFSSLYSYLVLPADLKTPLIFISILIGLVMSCIFGAGIAAIIALIFKKEKPSGFADQSELKEE